MKLPHLVTLPVTVPHISDVCCQRLTRERAYSPVLKYNEGLWKSQGDIYYIMTHAIVTLHVLHVIQIIEVLLYIEALHVKAQPRTQALSTTRLAGGKTLSQILGDNNWDL
jgi:hypothetical protein